MAHTLIQVGNSNAIIIPARIIKKRNYTSETEFDILETNDGLRLVQKNPGVEQLPFPKAARPEPSDKIKSLCGAVRLTPEEIENDERLQYILSR